MTSNDVSPGPRSRGVSHETLVDHFRSVLLERPEAMTYRFLVDGDGEPVDMSNAELDQRARAIAVALRERFPAGERALILCPPGLDYVASFFACLYAGVVAVPVYPPEPRLLQRTLPRLLGVIADAVPAVVLAPAFLASMTDQIAEHAPALGGLPWLAVDDVGAGAAEAWKPPAIGGDDIAFLQYTSGSTGRPKGVMVSHANLLHNLEAINLKFVGDDAHPRGVIWLPPYHDMGLIGGLLQPAYSAFPVTFMSPLSFLKRPARWLRAISQFKATISGAPNFAYDLCVNKIAAEDRKEFDLRSWRVAFTGAEPVRAETLDRFAKAFEPSGFRRSAFYPCYGLAEATLMVSGGDRTAEPLTRRVEADALTENRVVDAGAGESARTLVGCGPSIPEHEVLIVDPDALTRLPEGQVGEIWVSGGSVARGFWRRPDETREVFAARLADTGEGPFMRTGDLGFLGGGELYITGRLKDLIIIAGKNHYPHDLERSVERSHPSLRPGTGVAFSYAVGDEERLAIVHAVDGDPSKLEPDRIISAIRAAVADGHGLQAHDIALVRHASVPKTSSGKLRRLACKKTFLDGSLECVARWSSSRSPEERPNGAPPKPAVEERPGAAVREETPSASRSEIEARLLRELAQRLGVRAADLDPKRPIATYGLQSVDMVGMVGDLERWLGRKLPATLTWEYPTVEALAAFLGSTAGAGLPGAPLAIRAPVDQDRAFEPVAIIGIGCRFPGGADDPEAYWQLLCNGRDAVTEVPADRWKLDDFLDDDPSVPGKTNTRWGGFLGAVDGFDPHFFGISPREAARMDPQQRLLAEVAWEALEDAGVVPDRLAGSSTGVFIGIATSDYGHLQFEDLTRIDAYTGTGNAFSIAANRLSYLFDLRGPSMAIDTACSSSLVAVHLACMSLAQGDCTLALAGGVNLILSPALAINFTKAGAMAPDGRCKAFDARANGYVRAEGAGVVVLKSLAQARADGDTIYGVILGGAVNQDGRTNGLMAPNPHAQEAVIRAAYAKAKVKPAAVHYVEAHGTGTLLGDPIETKALSAVVATDRDPSTPCIIGSVKSNIGHLEAAAGIAGLIKVALMVRNRKIPPSLHYEQPNPHIPFGELLLRVADSLRPWPPCEGPALAGVSSFGFGGTNAHFVVQEAPPPASGLDASKGRPYVLPISARSGEALRALAARYEALLASPDAGLTAGSASFTAAVHRAHHEQRLACVGGSLEELREGLAAFARGEERPGLSWGERRVGRRPKVAFLFSGQGPRWWPLGADLLGADGAFRETLERCDALLRRHVEWSLLEELAAGPEASRLADTAIGQPALCAVQVALAALWRSWGIEPAAVVGHSVGEVAAAHVSGALGLEEALLVAVHRGRVIRAAVGKGKMAVAGVSLEQAQQLLEKLDPGAVSVASSNGPRSIVFSGEPAAVERLASALDADGIFCRVLESVDYASHSPQMEPLRGELERSLSGLRAHPAAVPMISTVTGEIVDGAQLGSAYWGMNLRQPVLFDRAVTALVESGHDAFVEISAHPMLGEAVSERIAIQQAAGAVVASLRRDKPGQASILAELGQLYSAGFPVDWSKVYGATGPRVSLPRYAWQRQRCWLDDEYARKRKLTHGGHPILETHVRSASDPAADHWCARVDLEAFPYLGDHRVDGIAVLPATFVLDAAMAAAAKALGEARPIVEDVRFTRMTVVDEVAEEATLQLVLLRETAGVGSFRLFSRNAGEAGAGEWTNVAQGRFRTAARSAEAQEQPGQALADVRGRCTAAVDPAEHYQAMSRAGLQYGPSFQGIEALWRGEREAVARLRGPAELSADRAPYLVHPALLDSCLQALAAALHPGDAQPAATYLPVGVGRFSLSAGGAVPRWAHAVVGATHGGDEISGARVLLFDEVGHRVGEVDGITLRRMEQAGAQDPVAESLFEVRWREVTDATPASAKADLEAGWWLLLDDRGGVCDALRAALVARGSPCVTVAAGDQYRCASPTEFEVDPARREDLATLLAELRDMRSARCLGVVYAWSLGAVLTEEGAATPQQLTQDAGAISALHVVQALAQAGWKETPRLVLLTRGAQGMGEETTPPALAQAALWGLARVIAIEHAELRPRIIDLDPARPAGEADRLLAEVARPEGADQICLRGDRRYAPKLERWTAPPTRAAASERRAFDASVDGNYRLVAARPGVLGSLTPTACERTPPGPGQVEIEVVAAGLNFSDVLKALDAYPGLPPGVTKLGAECAGRVSAVGEGVSGLRVGDEVMAVAPASFAAFATTAAHLVVPAPGALDEEQAASTPIAFLTAVYGIEHLARLGRGERILVHSATGGVGLAALQVARRNGAEIFATAGTEEKRELLRGLGVKHVMDSRSLRFADEIMEITGGRGVDVVLNSLAGEALTRSLSVLAPGGRFVEIGKQDIYGNSHVGLELFKLNRSFLAVDLEHTFATEPELVAKLFARIARGFDAGDFTPLPLKTFAFSDAEPAFSSMAKAQHIGKIVLRRGGHDSIAVSAEAGPVAAKATYLLTGGLGALGLEVARHLVDRGARHLVLMGRRPPSIAAEAILGELRSRGAAVSIAARDVSRYDDVAAVMAEIDRSHPPLRGVVHAAGLLDDGLLLQLDAARFRSVMAPKVEGAWNLHRATRDRQLDFFVLFSSAASLLGSPGQGNYASANAFLDALAHHRRAAGLPALSINWGPWAEIGLAARPDRGGELSRRGVRSLRPKDGIEALSRLMKTSAAQVAVLPLDEEALRAAAEVGLLPGLLAGLVSAGPRPTASAPRTGEVRQKLLAIEPGRRRRDALAQHCRTEIARVLKLDPSRVDTTAPLSSMGFDSLMSLELRKRLEASLEVTLPATLAWRFPTVEAIAPFLAERMGIALEAGADAPVAAQAAAEPVAPEGEKVDLEGLSDVDVEALLLEKVQRIEGGRE